MDRRTKLTNCLELHVKLDFSIALRGVALVSGRSAIFNPLVALAICHEDDGSADDQWREEQDKNSVLESLNEMRSGIGSHLVTKRATLRVQGRRACERQERGKGRRQKSKVESCSAIRHGYPFAS